MKEVTKKNIKEKLLKVAPIVKKGLALIASGIILGLLALKITCLLCLVFAISFDFGAGVLPFSVFVIGVLGCTVLANVYCNIGEKLINYLKDKGIIGKKSIEKDMNDLGKAIDGIQKLKEKEVELKKYIDNNYELKEKLEGKIKEAIDVLDNLLDNPNKETVEDNKAQIDDTLNVKINIEKNQGLESSISEDKKEEQIKIDSFEIPKQKKTEQTKSADYISLNV